MKARLSSREVTRVFLAVCCLSGVLAATGFPVMRLALVGDTFLPYEPILGRVVVTNTTDTPVRIPNFTHGLSQCISFSYMSSEGKALFGPGFAYTDPGPNWQQLNLPAGDSVRVDAIEISTFSGMRDPEAKGQSSCFLPGEYTVRASWNLECLGTSSPFAFESSNVVAFTVRKPTGGEKAALDIYRDIDYYVWHFRPNHTDPRDNFTERRQNVMALCRLLMTRHPVYPYLFLAKREMLSQYDQSLHDPGRTGTDSSSVRAWPDSIRATFRSMITDFPNSPLVVHYLHDNPLLLPLDGPAVHEAFLRELTRDYPATAVAREAGRQLKLIEENRGR